MPQIGLLRGQTSSISTDAMRTALDEHEKGNIGAAEEVLLDWVLDPETTRAR